MTKKNNTLSYSQTNNIKGFLILIIVLGHIQQFFTTLEMYTLYSFHITTFFFLPFLFNEDKLTLNNIRKIFRRYYLPYVYFFILALVLYTFYLHHTFNIFATLSALFFGNGIILRGPIGLSTYWFFPALISLLLLLMTYNSLSLTGRKIFLFFLIFTHFFITQLPDNVLIYFPFSSYVGLYIFIMGIVIKYIFNYTSWKDVSKIAILLLFILLLTQIYGTKFNLATLLLPNIFTDPVDFIMHDLVMIVGFFTMVTLSYCITLFQQLGKYSIAIYTIHPFVIQIINKTHRWQGIYEGTVKFLLVMIITYLLAKIIYTVKLDHFIYPR